MAGLFFWLMAFRLLPNRLRRGVLALAIMAAIAIVCGILTAYSEALITISVSARRSTGAERHYSFDYGSARLIVLAITLTPLVIAAARTRRAL